MKFIVSEIVSPFVSSVDSNFWRCRKGKEKQKHKDEELSIPHRIPNTVGILGILTFFCQLFVIVSFFFCSRVEKFLFWRTWLKASKGNRFQTKKNVANKLKNFMKTIYWFDVHHQQHSQPLYLYWYRHELTIYGIILLEIHASPRWSKRRSIIRFCTLLCIRKRCW